MPIVDSSRPSHRAPPFEPWLTGSGVLLLFWVGVIVMNGLVVVVTPGGETVVDFAFELRKAS